MGARVDAIWGHDGKNITFWNRERGNKEIRKLIAIQQGKYYRRLAQLGEFQEKITDDITITFRDELMTKTNALEVTIKDLAAKFDIILNKIRTEIG